MSARDVIAGVFRLQHRDLCYPDASSGECLIAADAIIAELEASGRSIVHKDKIHAPSVERAIAVAETTKGTKFGPEPHQYTIATPERIAAALRELMKEVGR